MLASNNWPKLQKRRKSVAQQETWVGAGTHWTCMLRHASPPPPEQLKPTAAASCGRWCLSQRSVKNSDRKCVPSFEALGRQTQSGQRRNDIAFLGLSTTVSTPCPSLRAQGAQCSHKEGCSGAFACLCLHPLAHNKALNCFTLTQDMHGRHTADAWSVGLQHDEA